MKTVSITLTHGPDAAFGAAWEAAMTMPDGSMLLTERTRTLPGALDEMARLLRARAERSITDEFYTEAAAK